ncbi:MAG: PEP-CTERM sorting domain-containing protein [Bryobacteraceae bacterium]
MKKLTSLACLCALAVPAAFGATLIHDYQFQGNLNDSLGGPALTSNGGTTNPADYTFGANQGLSLSNGFMNGVTPFADNYTMLIRFVFPRVNSTDTFAKILDFKNMASDNGLYSEQSPSGGTSALLASFLGAGSAISPSQVIFNGTPVTIVLSRNSVTGAFKAYAGGVLQFTQTDSGSDAVFNAANQMAKFFIDDSVTSPVEGVPGSVFRIMIWDGVLTDQQVGDLSAVPEPATFALFGVGLVAIGIARKRARR